MGEGVRSWGARAAYIGLAFCGFRVQIDQFNHLSSLQAVKTSSCHPSHPFQSLCPVLCFFLFGFFLCVN